MVTSLNLSTANGGPLTIYKGQIITAAAVDKEKADISSILASFDGNLQLFYEKKAEEREEFSRALLNSSAARRSQLVLDRAQIQSEIHAYRSSITDKGNNVWTLNTYNYENGQLVDSTNFAKLPDGQSTTVGISDIGSFIFSSNGSGGIAVSFSPEVAGMAMTVKSTNSRQNYAIATSFKNWILQDLSQSFAFVTIPGEIPANTFYVSDYS